MMERAVIGAAEDKRALEILAAAGKSETYTETEYIAAVEAAEKEQGSAVLTRARGILGAEYGRDGEPSAAAVVAAFAAAEAEAQSGVALDPEAVIQTVGAALSKRAEAILAGTHPLGGYSADEFYVAFTIAEKELGIKFGDTP